MNKKYLGLAVLLLIGGAAFLIDKRSSVSPEAAPANISAAVNQSQAASQAKVKEFTVIGTNFAFSPSAITVKKGDTVKIDFKDADGFHDLRISGYDVSTRRIDGGQEDSVTFVADQAGTFEYYCSVGSHRDLGMRGTLTVE